MMTVEHTSLSQKLTSMAVLSTATALLFVFIVFAGASVFKHRRDASMQLTAFAGVIGANSIDALLFKNKEQAELTLAALGANQDIVAAALFDRHGKLLARFDAPGRDPQAPDIALPTEDALPAADTILTTQLRVLHPLSHNGATIGTVLIEADLTAMWIDIAKAMGTMGGAMLGAMLVAMLMARRIKGGIVDPITKLINAAQKVSSSQNYTLRIKHTRTDELGKLMDSFNDMLAQIEGRGAALANHRDELERQVCVRTEQLEKAKNAAEAASRAKSAFLATMSHEIRTPMNGVLGMTEMLLGTALTDTQRNYTGMVKRSGEHLLVIINDILDFSKIEAGKLTIEYIHFNLWDLLDDIDHAFMPQVQAKGLVFDVDIAPDIPIAVCGDPNRLRQVLANLLGNAVKFTDRGRVTLKGRVDSEDAQGVTLRFEVHDTGIGISRDARQRIFEAFSQADNSTTRKYGGTGLGLAIARQLVELMGGKIGIDNAITQGSTFWFTVTFDKRRVDPDEAAAPPSAIEGSRALIVDEQASSRDVLARQLASWGVTCDTEAAATSAQGRLQQAARDGQRFDVALIDMDLQRTSGLALAAAIKADPLTKGTRIVLLSAERTAADLVQRRQAGVAYQLIKPARAGDLYECILMRPRGTLTAPVAAPLTPRKTSAVASARRRKVLLAEDNPVNVEVALAMLDSLGLDTTCARNGAEALQAAQVGTFDIVLMDCQMPVMDGFAATAEIRRQEVQQGQGRTLPIIAITANALAGDREACLAAGMDDYLSKPFTQQDLGATIARWIGVPLAATVHHDEAATSVVLEAPAVPERDIINHGALDHIRALSKDRGDALVHKVIHAFVDDTPLHLRTLRQAIVGADPNNMRKAAHSLKSSSANVGADHLAQLCKEMEHLGRTDTTEGASGILTTMEQEFQAVRHSLNAILEKET
jgi:two-component system sensor histidine kinase/response regulator